MATSRLHCIEFAEVARGSGPGDYRECRVSEFGEVGVVDSETLYYALYCLMPSYATAGASCAGESFDARYHRQRALAVFSRNASSKSATPLFARAQEEIGALYYEKPELIEHDGDTVLHLPIAVDGTGHGNASEYYLRRGGGWDRIDSDQWVTDLTGRLPKALQIWHGVWPDLRTMTAEAGLFRDGDPNCCPTGGVARVRLVIRGKAFVIDTLEIRKTP